MYVYVVWFMYIRIVMKYVHVPQFAYMPTASLSLSSFFCQNKMSRDCDPNHDRDRDLADTCNIRVKICTQLQKPIQTKIHTCVQTQIPLHTYIHTYTQHTYIHTSETAFHVPLRLPFFPPKSLISREFLPPLTPESAPVLLNFPPLTTRLSWSLRRNGVM